MKSIDVKVIRQIFTLVIIVIIGLLIFTELLPYLSGVLGAITIYVLLSLLFQETYRPIKQWISGQSTD